MERTKIYMKFKGKEAIKVWKPERFGYTDIEGFPVSVFSKLLYYTVSILNLQISRVRETHCYPVKQSHVMISI